MFDIQPSSTTPIYRQVVDQVRRLIAGGQLRAGDELPSVRSVADCHAINPMTVSKAYSLLEAEGLLTRRRGVGMAVAEGAARASSSDDRLALLAPALEAAAQQAQQLGIAADAALASFHRHLLAHPCHPTDPSP
jgi:GntR family transcriptional regulator